ncbi:MAG: DUF4178 domain-containing protein [Bryobacter sp.]|nr:DUF4178 domain-containing protein [Bryobacter sp.]
MNPLPAGKREASCPQCGAPVIFRWSQAVQTTCPYCNSILVRTDIDLKKVGEVSDYPLDPSPIQIGTEGVFEHKPFVVVGRIAYEWENGGWNEWHIVYNNGQSGWLSDAQLEYAVTKLVPWEAALNQQLAAGTMVEIKGVWYTVSTVTEARYRAVEGELPFEYWDKTACFFFDLRSFTGEFMTVDFTEKPALLFAGRMVSFEELKLNNVRIFEGWRP